MAFDEYERTALLALRGVGPTVLKRLEQMGLDSLAKLAHADPGQIVADAAAMVGSNCWKNSPQARSAIEAIVALARSRNGS